MDLTSRVALLSGASGGIGRALALTLARNGCHLLLHYHQGQERVEALQQEVQRLGVEALAVQADLANPWDCQRLVESAKERWQRLDVLINNAATTVFVAPEDLDGLDLESWDRIFAVNTRAPFLLARAAAGLLRQNRGAILNISSTAATSAVGSCLAYSASKAALNNLTLALAHVLAPEVRVNALAPGFVETEWLQRGLGERLPRVRRRVQTQTPLGQLATPEDVARAALAILTAMTHMTGQVITLDGGYLNRG